MSRPSQNISFLGTIWLGNGAIQETFCAWTPPETLKEHIVCAVWQHEIAPNPEPGRGGDHIQIFIRFKQRKRFNEIAALLELEPNECHWEPIKNGIKGMQAAWDYCTDDKPSAKRQTRHCHGGRIGERPALPGSSGERARRSADGRGQQSKRELAEFVVEFFKRPRAGGFRQFIGEGAGAEAALCHPGGVKFISSIQTAPLNTPDEWAKRDVFIYWGEPGRRLSTTMQSVRMELLERSRPIRTFRISSILLYILFWT